MKILFLYKYSYQYNFDHWFNDTYAKYVASHPGCELKMYGPLLHEVHPELTVEKYSIHCTLEQLYQKFPFDYIWVNTKSRMFDYYNTFTQVIQGCWLPKDFRYFTKAKKFVLEQDAHYETDDQWYREMKIELILQRHCSQVFRNWKLPNVWLPFSVDETVFKSDNSSRINKICFSGSVTSPYPERRYIIDLLKTHNLIDSFERGEQKDSKYVTNLRQYVSHVSGSSSYDICAAKNFEIMASGSVLFTNYFTGLTKLFPNNSYCLYNLDSKNDLSQALRILNDKNYRNQIVQNGLKCIKSKHTNYVRTNELMQILKDLL